LAEPVLGISLIVTSGGGIKNDTKSRPEVTINAKKNHEGKIDQVEN
jgi:hypothetical protein